MNCSAKFITKSYQVLIYQDHHPITFQFNNLANEKLSFVYCFSLHVCKFRPYVKIVLMFEIR